MVNSKVGSTNCAYFHKHQRYISHGQFSVFAAKIQSVMCLVIWNNNGCNAVADVENNKYIYPLLVAQRSLVT